MSRDPLAWELSGVVASIAEEIGYAGEPSGLLAAVRHDRAECNRAGQSLAARHAAEDAARQERATADLTRTYDEAVSLSYWLATQLGEHVNDQDGETLVETVRRWKRRIDAEWEADQAVVTEQLGDLATDRGASMALGWTVAGVLAVALVWRFRRG